MNGIIEHIVYAVLAITMWRMKFRYSINTIIFLRVILISLKHVSHNEATVDLIS